MGTLVLKGTALAHTVYPELDYEDMLWHLCPHLRLNAGLFAANHFIWVADLISFAEHFAVEIDL